MLCLNFITLFSVRTYSAYRVCKNLVSCAVVFAFFSFSSSLVLAKSSDSDFFYSQEKDEQIQNVEEQVRTLVEDFMEKHDLTSSEFHHLLLGGDFEGLGIAVLDIENFFLQLSSINEILKELFDPSRIIERWRKGDRMIAGGNPWSLDIIGPRPEPWSVADHMKLASVGKAIKCIGYCLVLIGELMG